MEAQLVRNPKKVGDHCVRPLKRGTHKLAVNCTPVFIRRGLPRAGGDGDEI